MTTHVAYTAEAIPGNLGPDPRALSVARGLRDAIDAECVILFGSRARGGWSKTSDLDLMIIEPEIPDADRRLEIERIGRELATQTYHDDADVLVDFVHLSRAEYERKSVHTLNHVARFARREGIMAPRVPAAFQGHDAIEDPDHCDEPMERRLRIADANTHYRAMHALMDAGLTDKVTALNAHQALEHAMKALISAQGHEYPHIHDLERLAALINQHDPDLHWQPGSNLPQLNNFAGGGRYGLLLTPISDFNDTANRATDDLNRIYGEIARLKGESPWDVPPDGSDAPTAARYR